MVFNVVAMQPFTALLSQSLSSSQHRSTCVSSFQYISTIFVTLTGCGPHACFLSDFESYEVYASFACSPVCFRRSCVASSFKLRVLRGPSMTDPKAPTWLVIKYEARKCRRTKTLVYLYLECH